MRDQVVELPYDFAGRHHRPDRSASVRFHHLVGLTRRGGGTANLPAFTLTSLFYHLTHRIWAAELRDYDYQLIR